MLAWLMYATLLVDPRAGRAEISGGVAVELRGGYAPTQPGRPEEASFLMLVVPNIDIRYRHRRAGVLGLGYAPRALMRAPNLLGVNRPLFLHQLALSYRVPLDRRWDMSIGSNAAIGELDYTSAELVFQGPQAQLADAAVLNFAIGDAELRFDGVVAPQHTITLATVFSYRIALDDRAGESDPEAGATSTLPDQRAGSLGLGYSYAASRRDRITVSSYNGLVEFGQQTLFLTNEERLGWSREVRRNVTSDLDVGLIYARLLEAPPPPTDPQAADQEPPRSQPLPMASARISGRLRSRARYMLDGSIATTYTGFFDAVRAQLLPRAGGAVMLNATFPPRWSVGLSSAYYTAATQRPIEVGDGAIPLTESIATNQVPVRYRINEALTFEFGAIANFRMPHVLAGTEGTQLELWGYVAFRAAGGTARGRREVGSRGIGGQAGQGGTSGLGRR